MWIGRKTFQKLVDRDYEVANSIRELEASVREVKNQKSPKKTAVYCQKHELKVGEIWIPANLPVPTVIYPDFRFSIASPKHIAGVETICAFLDGEARYFHWGLGQDKEASNHWWLEGPCPHVVKKKGEKNG